MNFSLTFCNENLQLLPSGALFWPDKFMLVVSDLHLGKSERIARRGGSLLPPYETAETLLRLSDEVDRCAPKTVLCLGDSFDDVDAANALEDTHLVTIQKMQAGRSWLWIEGNHDPGPLEVGGTHLTEHREGQLVFRHIAKPDGDAGEISGHYHPKARVGSASRPCFIADENKMIVPAFGAYTGGLKWTTPELRQLFSSNAVAYLTGRKIVAAPVPALN